MIKIRRIAKRSLVNDVAGRIRALIEQGKLQSGDRLPPESELVERLGVSRGALREAVKQLETVGLLTVAHGRGMFVSDAPKLSECAQLFRSAMAISPKDSLQFAEFRRIIECHLARRAAELATPADIAELERLSALMHEQPAREAGVQLDWQFHRKLAEIAGNELLLNVIGVLEEFVVAGIWHTARLMPDPEEERRSRELHRAIVEAIRSRNPDAAAQAMAAHMDALVDALQTVGRQEANANAPDPST
jgi:GntR family transcriptional repressor for pyruvate dehydrogenase complex